ncbi:radical SAM protein [Bradyrhizobium sp. F1.13.3]|uniref:B12-binding domain-containing radical SAM protein n=1 Tax=Bradyrhizobium sp. F1.13.3 TaxID=3156351 RepID=UPI00339481B6
MTSITFVFPRVLKEIYYEGCDYHLGAGYIRAYLHQHGIVTKQYLDGGQLPVHAVAQAILSGMPEFIGFSCYDANYYYIKVLAEHIKAIDPGVTIICGGPTATFSGDLILADCSAIDIVVEGYGEEATLELVRWKRGQASLAEIAGIRVRCHSDEPAQAAGRRVAPLRKLPLAQSIAKQAAKSGYIEPKIGLDAYPDPYVHGFIPPDRASDIGIVTSRGCAFPCTFCNFAAMSGRKVLFQSLEKVFEVFEFLDDCFAKNRGGKTLVTINDDNFSMHGKRFHELLERMAVRKFKHSKFWAEMRVEPLEKRSFRLMKEAGFHEINFGLESAVPHVLAAVKKVRSQGWREDGYEKERQYVEKIRWAVNQLKLVGIGSCVSVIFGSPEESLEDGIKTIEFLRELQLRTYAHNYITVRLGTELASNFEQFGIKLSNVPGRSLPLITTPPYDVSAVPILRHDESQLPIRGILLQDAIFLTSGMGHFVGRRRRPKDHGRGGAGTLVEQEQDASPVFGIFESEMELPETVGWLAAEKPMASLIWLFKNVRGSDVTSLEEALGRARVPTLEVHTISRVERGQQNSFAVGGSVARGDVNAIRFDQIVLSSEVVEEGFPHVAPEGPAIQFTITNDADLQAIARIAQLKRWRVPYSYLSRGTSVRDGCRWSGRTCPASTGERVLIRGRHVHPCLDGGAIGSVGTPLADIREHAKSMLEQEAKRRECVKCSAQTYCSQCLFTTPIPTDAFCDAQRRSRDFGALVDGLALGRSLIDGNTDPPPIDDFMISSLSMLEGAIEAERQTIPLASCLLLGAEHSEYAYLHSSRFSFSSKLNWGQRRAIESLI